MKIIAIAILIGISTARGMEKWEALGMQESGNDDKAIGQAGEVSRYQILPSVWKEIVPWPMTMATNKTAAKIIANEIMIRRIWKFTTSHHRLPTNLEWALLWKTPNRVDHPSKEKLDQAKCVVNLINRK